MCWSKRYLSVLLLLLVCVTGCKKTQEVPALKEQSESTQVDFQVEKRDLKQVNYRRGRVEARKYSQHFIKQGVIKEIDGYLGKRVKKGELLAKLECGDLEKQLKDMKRDQDFQTEQAKNSIKQKEIEIQLKELDIRGLEANEEEINTIQKEKLILEELKEDLRYQKELDKFQREQNGNRIAKLESEIKENYLYASCSGVITYSIGALGRMDVSAKETVFLIACEDEVYIAPDTPVVEERLKGVKELIGYINGEETELSYEFAGPDDGIQKHPILDGEEALRGQIIFPVKNGRKDMIGYKAIIGVVTRKIKQAVVVPEQALYQGVEGAYVYVKDGNNKTKTAVEVGRRAEGFVEISEGIEPGQTVYGEENMKLKGKQKEETVSKGSLDSTFEVDPNNLGLDFLLKCPILFSGEEGVMGKKIGSFGFEVKKGEVIANVQVEKKGGGSFSEQSQLLNNKKNYELQLEELKKAYSQIPLKESGSSLKCQQNKLMQEQLKLQFEHDKQLLLAQIKEKEQNSEGVKVTAPTDGFVNRMFFDDVQAGQKIYQNQILAVIDVPRKFEFEWLPMYNNGQEEGLTEEGKKDFDCAFSGMRMKLYCAGKTISGAVYQIADEQNTAFGMPARHIVLPDKGEKIGSYVDGYKMEGIHYRVRNGIVLSNTYIFKDDLQKKKKSFVWVKKENRIQRRYITVGFKGKEKSWIIDGLQEGETVVTDMEV